MPDPLMPGDDHDDEIDAVDFGSMSFGSEDDTAPVDLTEAGMGAGSGASADAAGQGSAEPPGATPDDVTPTMGIASPPATAIHGVTPTPIPAGAPPRTHIELTTSQAVQERRIMIGVAIGLLFVIAVIAAVVLTQDDDEIATTPTSVATTMLTPATTGDDSEGGAPSTSPVTSPSTVPATSVDSTAVPTTPSTTPETVAPSTTPAATTTTIAATITTAAATTTTLVATTTTIAATTTIATSTTALVTTTTAVGGPITDEELDARIPPDALGLVDAGFTLTERVIEPTGFDEMPCDDDGDFASITAASFVVEQFDIDGGATYANVYSFVANTPDKAALHRGLTNLGQCQGEADSVSTETVDGVTTTQARPQENFALIAVTGPGDVAMIVEVEGDEADERFDDILARARAAARA